MIIYRVTNTKNGRVYIGQTTRTLKERKRKHVNAAKRGIDYAFYRAIRKYGESVFKWEVIDTATTTEELNEKEKYWINFYDSFRTGYNETEGGEGALGREVSEETRKKLSEANKGKKHTEETRQRMREAAKKAWQDEERRRKVSEALKGEKSYWYGKTLPEETRKKIGEANRGENSAKAKLTAGQVVFIRALVPLIKTKQNMKADLMQKEIAEWLGVSNITVSDILTGRKWTHLPNFNEIRKIYRELYEQEYGNNAS